MAGHLWTRSEHTKDTVSTLLQHWKSRKAARTTSGAGPGSAQYTSYNPAGVTRCWNTHCRPDTAGQYGANESVARRSHAVVSTCVRHNYFTSHHAAAQGNKHSTPCCTCRQQQSPIQVRDSATHVTCIEGQSNLCCASPAQGDRQRGGQIGGGIQLVLISRPCQNPRGEMLWSSQAKRQLSRLISQVCSTSSNSISQRQSRLIDSTCCHVHHLSTQQ